MRCECDLFGTFIVHIFDAVCSCYHYYLTEWLIGQNNVSNHQEIC